jgi:hypothetical protein
LLDITGKVIFVLVCPARFKEIGPIVMVASQKEAVPKAQRNG